MGLWRVNDVVCGPLAYFFFELASNTAANRLPFLVKDVYAATTLTCGTVSYAGDLVGRFILFRDSSNARTSLLAALRRRLGLGLLRWLRDQNDRHHQLQDRLPRLPLAGESDGYGLCAGIPSAPEVSLTRTN
jgi:hypothetical protein